MLMWQINRANTEMDKTAFISYKTQGQDGITEEGGGKSRTNSENGHLHPTKLGALLKERNQSD
jgi:hypothetical protein